MESIREKERKEMIRRLNPHFLFNTLGAVRIVVRTDPEQAYDRIYDFSRYLRAVISSFEKQDTIPFQEELDNVSSYVNLEKMRFGDKVAFNMDLREKDFKIPPLSVLPLVENAGFVK